MRNTPWKYVAFTSVLLHLVSYYAFPRYLETDYIQIITDYVSNIKFYECLRTFAVLPWLIRTYETIMQTDLKVCCIYLLEWAKD